MSESRISPSTSDPWGGQLHIVHKIQPAYTNSAYPHLVDLNEFIKREGSADRLIILDYGAGASPYQGYFPNSDYRRADITGASYLAYEIQADSRINERDETFDLIISTQVAEHVPNPEVYFAECYRLLKKGGRLILTTHGIWEEHGSPYDFQRWTGRGLARDLREAGFQHAEIYKLTCGMRAAFCTFTRALFEAEKPKPGFRRLVFKTFRTLYSKIFPSLYRLSDRYWPNEKIVPDDGQTQSSNWYLAIAAIAKK